MIFSLARNLDPLHPREEIAKKLPHAGLTLPWPWDQVERKDLGSLGFGVRESSGESEGKRADGERVRVRESVCFKYCGTQNG